MIIDGNIQTGYRKMAKKCKHPDHVKLSKRIKRSKGRKEKL